jgi:hypothetical protein
LRSTVARPLSAANSARIASEGEGAPGGAEARSALMSSVKVSAWSS